MSKELRAIEYYKECIRKKQREAVTLAIDVDLKAMDRSDSTVLLKTIDRLDSAIKVMEQADAILATEGERMMDDLGHSMAPLNFKLGPAAFAEAQMAAEVSQDALLFFA